MKVKEFLKPNFAKLLIFLFIAAVYLYFAFDSVCGAGLTFTFCYKAYGFPASYLATGQIDVAFGYLKSSFLGNFFKKSGNLLINPVALLIDLTFIYFLACLLSLLLIKIKLPSDTFKKE